MSLRWFYHYFHFIDKETERQTLRGHKELSFLQLIYQSLPDPFGVQLFAVERTL
jgi:hypothetical protein